MGQAEAGASADLRRSLNTQFRAQDTLRTLDEGANGGWIVHFRQSMFHTGVPCKKMKMSVSVVHVNNIGARIRFRIFDFGGVIKSRPINQHERTYDMNHVRGIYIAPLGFYELDVDGMPYNAEISTRNIGNMWFKCTLTEDAITLYLKAIDTEVYMLPFISDLALASNYRPPPP